MQFYSPENLASNFSTISDRAVGVQAAAHEPGRGHRGGGHRRVRVGDGKLQDAEFSPCLDMLSPICLALEPFLVVLDAPTASNYSQFAYQILL